MPTLGPSVTVRVDLSDFSKAVAYALEHSSRTHQEVANGQSIALCRQAIKLTHKASRSDIASLNQRRQVGWRTRNISAKTGKMGRRLKKPKPIFNDANTFAMNIIISRFLDRNQPVPPRDQIKALADQMIAARIRSIAFIKSGWIPAIRALINWERAMKGRPGLAGSGSMDGARIYGIKKGGASPAKPGPRAVCRIWNEAIVPINKFNDRDRRGGNPMKYAVEGLKNAESVVVQDIVRHVREKYAQLARRRF